MLVLELLSVTGKPLSELLAPFKRYAASGEINTVVDDPAGAVELMAAEVVNLVEFPQGPWPILHHVRDGIDCGSKIDISSFQPYYGTSPRILSRSAWRVPRSIRER